MLIPVKLSPVRYYGTQLPVRSTDMTIESDGTNQIKRVKCLIPPIPIWISNEYNITYTITHNLKECRGSLTLINAITGSTEAKVNVDSGYKSGTSFSASVLCDIKLHIYGNGIGESITLSSSQPNVYLIPTE